MSAQSAIREAKRHTAWSVFMGLLTAALGAFLIVYPLVTAKVTTLLLGWVLILVAIAQVVFAFNSQNVGSFFLKLFAAALFGIIGAALAFAPMAGVEALTGLLGTLLLVQAGLATVAAFQMRPLGGWQWHLFEAATSFALGLLILVRWPSSSLWAIGMLVGVAVLVGGIARIVVAAKIQSEASSVEHLSSCDPGTKPPSPNRQHSVS